MKELIKTIDMKKVIKKARKNNKTRKEVRSAIQRVKKIYT